MRLLKIYVALAKSVVRLHSVSNLPMCFKKSLKFRGHFEYRISARSTMVKIQIKLYVPKYFFNVLKMFD